MIRFFISISCVFLNITILSAINPEPVTNSTAPQGTSFETLPTLIQRQIVNKLPLSTQDELRQNSKMFRNLVDETARLNTRHIYSDDFIKNSKFFADRYGHLVILSETNNAKGFTSKEIMRCNMHKDKKRGLRGLTSLEAPLFDLNALLSLVKVVPDNAYLTCVIDQEINTVNVEDWCKASFKDKEGRPELARVKFLSFNVDTAATAIKLLSHFDKLIREIKQNGRSDLQAPKIVVYVREYLNDVFGKKLIKADGQPDQIVEDALIRPSALIKDDMRNIDEAHDLNNLMNGFKKGELEIYSASDLMQDLTVHYSVRPDGTVEEQTFGIENPVDLDSILEYSIRAHMTPYFKKTFCIKDQTFDQRFFSLSATAANGGGHEQTIRKYVRLCCEALIMPTTLDEVFAAINHNWDKASPASVNTPFDFFYLSWVKPSVLAPLKYTKTDLNNFEVNYFTTITAEKVEDAEVQAQLSKELEQLWANVPKEALITVKAFFKDKQIDESGAEARSILYILKKFEPHHLKYAIWLINRLCPYKAKYQECLPIVTNICCLRNVIFNSLDDIKWQDTNQRET